MVCGSVSAPNINEALNLRAGNTVSRLAEQVLRQANPQCHHVELDSHGYCFVTLSREEAQMHWLRVDDVLRPGSPVRQAHALTYRPGAGVVS